MKLLYSHILPLSTKQNQQTITDCIIEQISKSTEIEIAVGYISTASLIELDELVRKFKIKHVCLIIGMYYIEGMPEGSYHVAKRINNSWIDDNIGEIRFVQPFKYHGKMYCFYKNGKPFASIVGSANLSVLKLDANTRRQYETATLSTDAKECKEISEFIQSLKVNQISSRMDKIHSMPLVREHNAALSGIENVTKEPPANVKFYHDCVSDVHFSLPLKVPTKAERHLDDGKHFTKSNVNVCYAAPRSKRKPRDWFETQLTVANAITRMDGYPEKNKPFFIVTDDGFRFKAHTTSDFNKQFSAVGDELIMGRWLKGRLVAANLIKPVNNTQEDTDRVGMITQEILNEYGCTSLKFKKTGQTELDEEGTPLDIWLLSFNPDDQDDENGVNE